MKQQRKKRTNSSSKKRAQTKKAQTQANKYAYRLETKKLKHDRFVQKQKTKRISQIPEAIKATGKAIALASSPTASSIASSNIVNSNNEVQMKQLINPTQIAGTTNEEEDKAVVDNIKDYLPR